MGPRLGANPARGPVLRLVAQIMLRSGLVQKMANKRFVEHFELSCGILLFANKKLFLVALILCS
jgi:hypothetical protein